MQLLLFANNAIWLFQIADFWGYAIDNTFLILSPLCLNDFLLLFTNLIQTQKNKNKENRIIPKIPN
jgi:hypothetical protein